MKSIIFRFFIFIAILLIIMVAILNTFPVISSRDLVFTEKENALSGRVSTITSSLSGLDSLTPEGVREVLNILDVGGYSHLTVTDAEGNIVYEAGASGPAGTCSEDIKTALGKNSVFRSDFSNKQFVSAYSAPIVKLGEIEGCLRLEETDAERAALIMDVQGRIRTISITASIYAFVFAALSIVMLTGRIRDMTASMRIVAGGDYSHRLKVKGNDEISELGDEFNVLTERLEKTEKQRRRFVSDASHELKTPLASIKLLSDSALQSDNVDEDTMREFMADISHEAERLQRTTEKLLDLSRMDDGVKLAAEPVDVQQSVLDAMVLLEPLAKENGVTIESSLEDGCVIMATADDMFHIIFNLMENAIKYNVPDGKVTVSLRNDGEYIFLTVSDTGIGIPEEDRLNVFSRFYRVDKARSRASGGSGLGLSIVHDAVIARGGTITVGANKPQGSVFAVCFPAAKEEETGI